MMNLTRRFGLAVAVLGLMAGASGQAKAAITVYLNRPAFEAALGTPITTETFDDAILTPGLTFTSNTGAAFISGGVFNDQLEPGENTTFSFVPVITGFGANFNLTPGGPGLGIVVTSVLPGGGTEVVSQEIPNNFSGQFFGFISSGAVASVQLTSGTQGGFGETYNLDNLTFGGSVSAVPEPSTLISGSMAGLLGLGAAWRRRKRVSA